MGALGSERSALLAKALGGNGHSLIGDNDDMKPNLM